MPAGFEACIKARGRVRRISGPSKFWDVPAGHYRNICWDSSNKPHRGELHKKSAYAGAKKKALSKL